MAVHARTWVQEVILPDHLGVGIGEKSVGVAGFAAEVGGYVRLVYANGYGTNAQTLESGQLVFDTP